MSNCSNVPYLPVNTQFSHDGADRYGELIVELTPVIRGHVRRALARCGNFRATEDRVADLVQEAILMLLSRGPGLLQSWDPTRGLPLSAFVGLIAGRATVSLLRSGRRSARAEQPTDARAFEAMTDSLHPERVVEAREAVRVAMEQVSIRLDERGAELFESLFLHEDATEQACERFNITPNAVYCFRRRTRRMVLETGCG